ncbi:hypothetical protein NESM_000690600 [Novymonas esmeraldas]|uniref:Uncharacterized protein n=1 Tax=Novymonas esmeraldas TaxID=1808958 RepID=A0AAW0EV67_9TRYP
MSAARTHVVDLGQMPREDLIEIAKKQANQIREKNRRISAMESFIEGVTGTPAEQQYHQPPSPQGQLDGPHRAAVLTAATANDALAASAPSVEPGEALTAVAQLRETRQMLEEQQMQHTLLVSQLEEQLRERQRDYDQLQAKVDAWKSKVMAAMTSDQERIRELQAQLAAASHAAPPPLSELPSAPPPPPSVLEAQHSATHHEQQAQIASLRRDLDTALAALHAAQAQAVVHHQPASTTPALSSLEAAAPASASSSASFAAASTPPTSPSSAPAPLASQQHITAASIPPDVLRDAVAAKLASWKERVTAAMTVDRDRIAELEAQLSSMQRTQHTPPHDGIDSGHLADTLRAEVDRLRAELSAAAQEREAAEESAGSEVETQRAAFKQQITELNAESDALRAEVDRLQAELSAAAQEREAAVITVDAFRAKMEDWKVKVRSVVADGERQRRTLTEEVQALRSTAAAATAAQCAAEADATRMREEQREWRAVVEAEVRSPGVEKTERCVQTDGTDEEEKPVAAAAVPVSIKDASPTVDGIGVPPELTDAFVANMHVLLAESKRVAEENVKLRRAVAELSRFHAEVMREVHGMSHHSAAAV